jgi:hypothetical protein
MSFVLLSPASAENPNQKLYKASKGEYVVTKIDDICTVVGFKRQGKCVVWTNEATGDEFIDYMIGDEIVSQSLPDYPSVLFVIGQSL